MKISDLQFLLEAQFPVAKAAEFDMGMSVGSLEGWDSMAHFNFLLLIEESYGIRFSVEEMSELKSLQNIADALKDKNVAS